MKLKNIKKLPVIKAITDFFIILILIGLLTGILTEEFYKWAWWFLIPGGISTLMFIIKSMSGK